jgi:cytochrome c oxidase subunit 1
MTATLTPTAAPAPHFGTGILDWITTTDHKHIGIMYMVTTFGFFLVGGILAIMMRMQLAQPGLHVLARQVYNQVFTLHGTTMIFLFIAPFGLGLGNYLVPLQVGAPDMAFPRLNALSYWLLLAGGLTIFSGLLTSTGAAAAGWTGYAPLSGYEGTPGPGIDLWILGVLMTSAASIMTAINILVTVILFRAPGMTMMRMPIFTWNMITTSLLVLMAFPTLGTALSMLFIDRRLGGHFFDPSHGGSAILYQHLFWWFGHPEVYVLILPYFGVVTEVISAFSRKPVYGYLGLVLASFAIAGLSMTVWAHHMFTTGAVTNPFFSIMSFLIAVPTGVKYFNWIGTMWKGQLIFPTAMLFVIGFMVNFLIGGITGVMVASPPLDYHVEDSYFLVSHFHYVIAGGSLFAVFAAIYFWFPKFTGAMLREELGRLSFWLTIIGFNVTFLPWYALGIMGMPRRVQTYLPLPGYADLNLASSIGAGIMAVGVILTVWNIAISLARPIPAGDNPWDAFTLEWATSSPPPEHNFDALPPIRSERPAFDLRYGQVPEQRRLVQAPQPPA